MVETLQHSPDLGAFEAQLRTESIATLQELSALTERVGKGWKADYSGFGAMQAEGELCASYARTVASAKLLNSLDAYPSTEQRRTPGRNVGLLRNLCDSAHRFALHRAFVGAEEVQ